MITVFILIIILVFEPVAWGGPKEPRYAPSADLEAALDTIYHARFREAQALLVETTERFPKDPRGFEFLATLYDWWRKVCRGNAPHDSDEMINLYEQAVLLSRMARKIDLKDRVALLSLGNAHLRLTKKYRDKKQWMKVVNSGGLARRYLDRALFLDKKDPSPKMGLGAVNYYAANLPGPLKPLAALIGFGGNRGKGLKLIEEAARAPGFYQADAAYLLADIFTDKENDFEKGVVWYRWLAERYPDNPDFACSAQWAQERLSGKIQEGDGGKSYKICRAKRERVCD